MTLFNERMDAQKYKGNDIDSDGDGIVDNADQVDGQEASDIGNISETEAIIASVGG